jgi:hypothetical protein
VNIKWKSFIEYLQLNSLYDICRGGDGLLEEQYKCIALIKDGVVLNHFCLENNTIPVNELIKYDNNFDIISFCAFDTPKNYIALYKSIPESIQYIPTNYHFIHLEILLNDISIIIHLNSENYNYYVVNNFINDKFILYFLKMYYSDKVNNISNEDILKYKLIIIDNNVLYLEIDYTQQLTFYLDNYIVTKVVDENLNIIKNDIANNLERESEYVEEYNIAIDEEEKNENSYYVFEESLNHKLSSSLNFVKETINIVEEEEIIEEYMEY